MNNSSNKEEEKDKTNGFDANNSTNINFDRANMIPQAPFGYAGYPTGFPMPTGYPSAPVPMGYPAAPVPMGYPAHMPVLMPMGLAPVAPTTVPMNPDTTGYFGNLSPNISDEVVTAILSCSGGFKRLKRPVDPSTGKSKPFALVEYESVNDLSRAFRLFQDFVLDNRHLNIKIENNSISENTGELQVENLKCYEGISRVLIGKRMTSSGSMEWLEKRISQLKKQEQQQAQKQAQQQRDRRDSRQRNYSDLIDDNFNQNRPEATNSKSSKSTNSSEDALISLKDRERRWEGKLREFERELLRDLERDEEREKRHAKEAAELAGIVAKYSDETSEKDFYGSLEKMTADSSEILFFSDREKWQKIREKAKEKEKEIFGDLQEIRGELEKSKKEEEIREFIEKQLPLEIEELFAFPVEFKGDSKANFKGICGERTAAFFKAKSEDLCLKLGEIIYEKIAGGCDGSRLIRELAYEPTFLAVSDASIEAEILIVILWRWLIYYTKFGF